MSEMESAQVDQSIDASTPYVGRWNQLVSTTNWEKGRIISQWRKALADSGAAVSEYSDETWAQKVGRISSQHVGRLRRVYEQFGSKQLEFDGLYWSHFQAAIDWEDAEMWLEGALQSQWSVSSMRRQRWETLGAIKGDEPGDEEIISAELDEDFDPTSELSEAELNERVDAVRSEPIATDGNDQSTGGTVASVSTTKQDVKSSADSGAAVFAESDRDTAPFVRPFEHLSELPSDLGEAFEQYKLAILRHKMDGWQEVTCEDVLASLDALKELATAPSDD